MENNNKRDWNNEGLNLLTGYRTTPGLPPKFRKKKRSKVEWGEDIVDSNWYPKNLKR